MKKVILISLLTILLVTGCGNNKKEEKLVCTTSQTENGITINNVVSMIYKNNKLKNMKLEVSTKLEDVILQENWENFKVSMGEVNKEFDKDGVSLKVQKDEENYIYKIIYDIDIQNATQEALERYGFESLKKDKSTLESTKRKAEKDGIKCEIE